MKPGSPFRISGYSCLRDDRSDGYAGSALLVRANLPFYQISLPSHPIDINLVAVRVFDISFISIYISQPNSSLISEILLTVASVPTPIIILGDFNGHHTSWGSSHSNTFGRLLSEMFDEANLCVINDGSITRRVLPSQDPQSVVDLTVCSPSLSFLLSWKTLPLSYGSDHFPIVITMSNCVTPQVNFNPSLKYRLTGVSRADWEYFTSTLDVATKSLIPVNIHNALSAYSMLVNVIISNADNCFPIKKQARTICRVSSPWWDSDCTAVIRNRKIAEIEYNNSMSDVNFIKYQRCAAEARKILTKKKKIGWKNFCENISPRTPSSVVWNQIKRFRGSCNYTNPSSNDPSSWIESFSDRLSPTSVPNIDSIPSSPSFISPSSYFDNDFSIIELNFALDGLKDSSPGIDGIPYSFIVNSPDSVKEYYLKLINIFFGYGIVPDQWKTQIVIPICKPGKSRSDPNSYRPIALSSVLVKVMEHMIKFRLEWIVESGNILAKTQFGFRKGMSTMDSLSLITSDIRIAFLKKESLVAVFLDIASAYDNVLLPILRNKLHQLSIPSRIVRYICNLLMDRNILIKHQGSFLPSRRVWKGLPQGSVLSPLLFSLYTHDLDHSISPLCQVLQYADDLALYVRSNSISDVKNDLNTALTLLGEWLKDHGLSLSASKSSCVIFSKKRIPPVIDLYIEQEKIRQLSSTKFLGVYLDSRLSGVSHCNYIADVCEKNINVLRSLSGVWWGSHLLPTVKNSFTMLLFVVIWIMDLFS